MGYGEKTSAEVERIAREIVDSALKVHRHFGPGLLESVYERSLAYELSQRGETVERQVVVPVRYGELEMDEGFRLDLLVGGLVVVEVKAVEQEHEIHKAQLLTYLKMTGLTLGLLINFNRVLLKDGIKRLIN